MTVRILVCTVLLMICSSSYAATIVFDPASTSSLRVVNRIEGLVIDMPELSGIYDVTFTSASYSSIQAAGGFPVYDLAVGDRAVVANAVIELIIAELNETDANKVGALGSGLLNSGVGYLPYADAPGGASVLSDRAIYAGSTGPWGNSTAASIAKSTGAGGFVFIELTPVPLPAGGLLLATAMGAATLRLRRKPKIPAPAASAG